MVNKVICIYKKNQQLIPIVLGFAPVTFSMKIKHVVFVVFRVFVSSCIAAIDCLRLVSEII